MTMSMNRKKSTRRSFLKGAGLGMVAAAMSSCVSMPGTRSQSGPFTFVQICDTQLGMGGYEHDVTTFKAAVRQINDYHGMQLVNGETTSKNFDERPFGFRLWHVEGERPFTHEFVPLVDL